MNTKSLLIPQLPSYLVIENFEVEMFNIREDYKDRHNRPSGRQWIGKAVEIWCERNLGIQLSTNPTDEFDGILNWHGVPVPVQIKTMKQGSELCLGDFRRNYYKNVDFIMIICEYNSAKTRANIGVWYIQKDIWKSMFPYSESQVKSMIDFLESISTKAQDDSKWKLGRQKFTVPDSDTAIATHRFKRGRSQKRLQAAIPYRYLSEAFRKWKLINI